MLKKTGIIVKYPHTHSFIYKTSHSLSPASGRLARGHPADSNSAAKFSLVFFWKNTEIPENLTTAASISGGVKFTQKVVKLGIDPLVGTPTWECPLPREIVKKSHFPLWVSRGTQVWDPTQYVTEWVILTSLLWRKTVRVWKNDVFCLYVAQNYSMKCVTLTWVGKTHD